MDDVWGFRVKILYLFLNIGRNFIPSSGHTELDSFLGRDAKRHDLMLLSGTEAPRALGFQI